MLQSYSSHKWNKSSHSDIYPGNGQFNNFKKSWFYIGTPFIVPVWKDDIYDVLSPRIEQLIFWKFAFLRLRIIAKSAILGKSIEKLLPIYQIIGVTEKQIAVWTWKLVTLFNIMLTR